MTRWEATKTLGGEKWITHAHIAGGYVLGVGYKMPYKISCVDSLDPNVAAFNSGSLDHWGMVETLRSGT